MTYKVIEALHLGFASFMPALYQAEQLFVLYFASTPKANFGVPIDADSITSGDWFRRMDVAKAKFLWK